MYHLDIAVCDHMTYQITQHSLAAVNRLHKRLTDVPHGAIEICALVVYANEPKLSCSTLGDKKASVVDQQFFAERAAIPIVATAEFFTPILLMV